MMNLEVLVLGQKFSSSSSFLQQLTRLHGRLHDAGRAQRHGGQPPPPGGGD